MPPVLRCSVWPGTPAAWLSTCAARRADIHNREEVRSPNPRNTSFDIFGSCRNWKATRGRLTGGFFVGSAVMHYGAAGGNRLLTRSPHSSHSLQERSSAFHSMNDCVGRSTKLRAMGLIPSGGQPNSVNWRNRCSNACSVNRWSLDGPSTSTLPYQCDVAMTTPLAYRQSLGWAPMTCR